MGNYPLAGTTLSAIALHQLPVIFVLAANLAAAFSQIHNSILHKTGNLRISATRRFSEIKLATRSDTLPNTQKGQKRISVPSTAEVGLAILVLAVSAASMFVLGVCSKAKIASE